jgi:DNA-directed RNA polymerase subunit H
MGEHPGFMVFQTLPAFFQSRGLTPRSSPNRSGFGSDRSRFVTELERFGYFGISGNTADGSLVEVLLLAARGKYAEHGPQLRQLLSSSSSGSGARSGNLAEVLLIAPEEMLGKKHMLDVVAEFAPLVAVHPYHIFSFDLPSAQCVPRHEILSPAAVAAFLARDRLSKSDLKTMRASDPPLVWLGARPGDVVQTSAPSETCGEALDVWFVVPG